MEPSRRPLLKIPRQRRARARPFPCILRAQGPPTNRGLWSACEKGGASHMPGTVGRRDRVTVCAPRGFAVWHKAPFGSAERTGGGSGSVRIPGHKAWHPRCYIFERTVKLPHACALQY